MLRARLLRCSLAALILVQGVLGMAGPIRHSSASRACCRMGGRGCCRMSGAECSRPAPVPAGACAMEATCCRHAAAATVPSTPSPYLLSGSAAMPMLRFARAIVAVTPRRPRQPSDEPLPPPPRS